MKNICWMKKGLAVVIILLLMGINIIPTVSSLFIKKHVLTDIQIGKNDSRNDKTPPVATATISDDIDFPKENGPYKFMVIGFYIGEWHYPITINIPEKRYNIGPFCYIHNATIESELYAGCHISITDKNSNHTKIVVDEYTYSIIMDMKGFYGYMPAYLQLEFKIMYFGDWAIMFGITQEIDFS